MSTADRLDIIIFGATGFTGKRTIPQLTKLLKEEKLSLTWGVAGRSEAKLKEALMEMQQKTGEDYSKIPVKQADVDDIESLEKMTASARIIINAVGPYRFYGERVIQACIKSGTHHVDVSGEPQFIETMQLKYHDITKEKGIYVISACGFDSIPSDLGAVFLQKNFEGTVNSIESYMYCTEEGGPYPGATVHYGTYESAVHGIAHWNELKTIRTKLYPEKLPLMEPKLKTKRGFFKNEFLNRWCTRLLGADRSIMMRTQRFMLEERKRRPAQVQCYICYDSFFHLLAVLFFSAIIAIMSTTTFTRNIILKYPKLFTGGFVSHEGPSEEKQDHTLFNFVLLGQGWVEDPLEPTDQFFTPPEKTVIARISGRNPGYGATCVMLAASAIVVLTQHDKMPNKGGCYSPGIAFGDTSMVEILKKHGIKFDLNPVDL